MIEHEDRSNPLIPSQVIKSKSQPNWDQTSIQHPNDPYFSQPITPNNAHLKAVSLSKFNEMYNDPFGHILAPKPENTIRLYYININGISFDNKGGEFQNICQEIHNSHIDIMCLCEHNLAIDLPKVKSSVFDCFKEHFDHSKLSWSTSAAQVPYVYRQGGTFSAITQQLVSRVRSTYSDSFGRWNSIELSGSKGQIVHIISIYQVPKDTIDSAGPNTAFSHQYHQLRQEGRRMNDPRKNFIKDLETYIQHILDQGQQVIVGGDFNDTINYRQTSLSKMYSKLNLKDPYSYFHGAEDTHLATYARGRKRLDYVFVSEDLQLSLKACGYDPFCFRFHSDHRGFFLDLDERKLFGSVSQSLAPMSARDILSKHASSITNYINARYEYYESNKVFEKMEELSVSHSLDIEALEKIDRNFIRGALHAGSCVKRLRQSPWFSQLHILRRHINYTKRLMSCYRLRKNPHRRLIPHFRNQDPTYNIPLDYQEAKALFKLLIQKVRTAESQARQKREEELDERIRRAHNLVDQDQDKIAKIIRQIKKAEKVKQMFQKLRFYRQKKQTDGISQIEVPTIEHSDPKKCTDWRLVDSPKEIVEILLRRNQKHFGQALGTPFTVPPLLDEFQFDGCTRTAELCLHGEQFTHDDLDSITHEMIKHLQAVTPLDSLPDLITEEQFISKIKSWNEFTSTSPSGLHLGHYHALIKPHDVPKEDEEAYEEIESRRSAIISLHVSIINYCISHSYSLERWRNIVTCMIRKEPGNSKIHRLRVIHLYEADFNLLVGIKWRSTLFHAEKNNLLNDGQYGSRPHRNAIDPVFIEEMETEISRVSRRPNLRFDNDATSCYDRILCSVANAISRKYGIHRQVCLLEAATLQAAKYKLKTLLGISEEYYSHSTLAPIFGTGQGSTCSPTIWALISSTLFDIHEDLSHGAHFSSPDGALHITFSMIGYVDDSSCHSTIHPSHYDPSTQVDSLLYQMKNDAQLWSDILWTSGGALELPKCSYHMQAYNFTASGSPSLLTIKQPITLTDPTGASVQIHGLSPHSSHKILGCHKSPDGNQKDQKSALLKRSRELAMVACKSPLTIAETKLFYFAIFLPSITYPLPTSFFNEKELQEIQRPVLNVILSKSGFNCHTARDIVYAPRYIGGCGFYNLYTLQGLAQIRLFLRHWRDPTSQCGKLLRIAVSWNQVHLGLGQSFLSNTQYLLPYSESKWLTSLHDFLHSIDASLSLDEDYVQPLQRVWDRHIMDIVVESQQFSDTALRHINYCRLYLQVTTLSDLAYPHGLKVYEDFYCGRHTEATPTLRQSITDFPRQDEPNNISWTSWRKACQLWMNTDYTLKAPLGPWTIPYTQRRMCHPTQKAYSDQTLLPSRTLLSLRNADTFQSYLQACPPWEQQLFDYVTVRHTAFEIASATQSQAPFYSSDGSVSNTFGTFGWLSVLPDETVLAFGRGDVPGTYLHPYRAELTGLLSVLRFHIRIHEYCQVAIPSLRIYTDSQSSIDKIHGYHLSHSKGRNSMSLSSEWDLLQAIHLALQSIPTPQINYVRAHQDKRTPHAQLSLSAKMNIVADSLATFHHHLRVRELPFSSVPFNPASSAQLEFHGVGTITGAYKQRLVERAHAQQYYTRLCHTMHWSPSTFQLCDTNALKLAINRSTRPTPQLVKVINDLVPTNKIINRYSPHVNPTCPHCPADIETFEHVLRCAHPDRQSWWFKLPDQLMEFFSLRGGAPLLMEALIIGLECWYIGDHLDVEEHDAIIRPLLRSQSSIGWSNMFRGHISCEWALVQDDYNLEMSETPDFKIITTGPSLAAHLIAFMWELWFTVWETRNNIVHDSSLADHVHRQKQIVHGELLALYSKRHLVLPADKALFKSDPDFHIQTSSFSALQSWVTSARQTVQSSIKQASEWAISHVRPIHHYFPRLYFSSPDN